MKSSAILLITTILIGCGVAKNNEEADIEAWSGKFNAAGYPDIDGDYAFITVNIGYRCSDESTGTSEPISFNISVLQDANEITIPNRTDDLPGLTILEQTEATGLVEKSGAFSATKSAIIHIAALDDDVTYQYSQNGDFTPSSWSGNYKFTAIIPKYQLSCKYSTTFRGDKIASGSNKITSRELSQDIDASIVGIAAKAGLLAFFNI
ncbi:MAG: hypothetical protein OEY38_12745 [Gammaproteobacteria bacterium]|nr:hypothetical protein [Gammaproteobacteria bacterium]